jgi:hypothetical protein
LDPVQILHEINYFEDLLETANASRKRLAKRQALSNRTMSEMTPTDKPSSVVGDSDKPTEVEEAILKKEQVEEEQEQEEQEEEPKKDEETKEEKGSEDAPAEDAVIIASTEDAAKGADAETSEKADASVDKEDKSDASGEEEPASNGDVSPSANVEGKVGGDTKLLKELDDEAPKTFPQVVSDEWIRRIVSSRSNGWNDAHLWRRQEAYV